LVLINNRPCELFVCVCCLCNSTHGKLRCVGNVDIGAYHVRARGGNACVRTCKTKTTRNSAVADKPARRVYRSLKVTKHSTIPYVRHSDSFLLCNSNFVFKTRRFYDIRLQKCSNLENRVRGPSRSLEMSPVDMPHTTSYWRSIVTMALFRVVYEIFKVEKCRDLEMGSKVTQGHW